MRFWWLALLMLIGGAAGQDRLSIGQPFELMKNQRVTGNVVSIGSRVEIQGQVLGSVVVFGAPLTLGPKALVGKDVVVLGGNITKAAGARILGETTQLDLPPLPRFGLPELPPLWLQSLLMGGLVLILGSVQRDLIMLGANRMREHPWKALGWGGLTWILVPTTGILLLFTLVGIVLLPFHLLASLALALTGMAVSVQWLGQCMLPHRPDWIQRLLGALVLVVIGFIPWLGPLTQLSAVLCGSGSLVRHFWLNQRLILNEVR